MKLAIVGTVVLVLGVLLSIPGAAAAGGVWILTGLLAHLHVRRTTQAKADQPPQPAGTAKPHPQLDGKSLAIATVIMLAAGLPPLAIAVFRLGLDRSDTGWRWGLGAAGALLAGFALISALMYLLGSAATAAAEGMGVPELPATITIRAVRETGTYINERPRLEFDLLVQPEGAPSYEVTKKATVPYTAMGSLGVGDGFHAKVVGPDKPTAMEIDWDAPIEHAEAGADPAARLAQLDKLRSSGTITSEEYAAQRKRILDAI